MDDQDSLKRKNETPGDISEPPKEVKKKRGKKSQTPTVPVPIAIPLSAKIGIQPLYPPITPTTSTTTTPTNTKCADGLNLDIMTLHPALYSPFDFFMLPFEAIPNDNNQSLLPDLISPTQSSLAKISEILRSLSIQKDNEHEWLSKCFVCVPSSTTKKQQNIIVVIEPPSSIVDVPEGNFSAFVLQALERFDQDSGAEVAIKISVGTDQSLESEWAVWNSINQGCNYHTKLGIALEVKSLRHSFNALCTRWKGEELKLVLFQDTLIPSINKFPSDLKNFLSYFSNFTKQFAVQTILPKEDKAPTSIYDFPKLYKYLSMRIVSNTKLYGIEANFLAPYMDKLQIPLQPLEEDLTPEVYNVFEKCPVKYRRYQEAIYLALRAREIVASAPIIVMVVGAGRGPLVLQTIVASQRARRPVKIYALDKNPHAIKALQELQRKKQWEEDEVAIIDADMRTWNPPEKADILVSELLGSFGDNELSPECLDSAQRFLNKDGISIPQRYTSFLAPISSTILHREVLEIVQRASAKSGNIAISNNNITPPENGPQVSREPTMDQAQINDGNNQATDINPAPAAQMRKLYDMPAEHYFEVGYVVKLHNVLYLDDSHRHTTILFYPKMDGVLHGFAGFFETQLFDKISFSTNPPNNDHNLVAWFPMYFPLKEPMMVRKDSQLEVNFWRKISNTQVWYEWCVGSPDDPTTFIYNTGGRAYSMNL